MTAETLDIVEPALRVRRVSWVRHVPLIAILVGFVALSVTFNFRTPTWEANDEFDHAMYVEQMAREWRAPVISVLAGHESHQPPLAYAMYAAWQRALGMSPFLPVKHGPGDPARRRMVSHDYTPQERVQANDVHALRLLSTLEGLALVLAVFAFARAMTKDRAIALGAAALTAAWPKILVLSATINNDIGAIAASAVALAALISMLDATTRRRRAVHAALLGLALGACALMKYTTLPLIGLVGLILIVSAIRRRAVWPALIAIAVAAASSLWWFIGNIQRYGDPLASKRTLAYLQVAFRRAGLIVPVSWFDHERFLVFVPRTVMRTFIYDAGWNQLKLPPGFDALVTAVIVVSAIAGCALARRRIGTRNAVILIGSILAAIAALLIIAKSTTQAEGRYLLTGVSAIAVAMILPVTSIRSERGRIAVLLAWPALFLALDAYVLLVVMRGFAGY